MTPIINPFYIYLIERLDPLHGFLHVVVILSVIICIGNLIYYFYTKDTTQDCYTSFLRNEEIAQNLIIENAYKAKNEFSNIIKILQEKVEEETDKDKIKRLQSTADHCCMVLHSIRDKIDDLAKTMDVYNNTLNFCKRWAFRCFLIAGITAFVDLMIPSTETAYKMLVTSYITPDNLDLMKNTSKEAIEWTINSIINAIQSMR